MDNFLTAQIKMGRRRLRGGHSCGFSRLLHNLSWFRRLLHVALIDSAQSVETRFTAWADLNG